MSSQSISLFPRALHLSLVRPTRIAAALLCLARAGTLHAQSVAATCADTTASIQARAEACVAVTRQKPRDGAAHREAGEVLRLVDRTEEAIEHYRKAIEIDSKDSEAHHGLGHALSRLDRDDEALRALRRARELSPDELELWYDIVWLLDYLDRSDTVANEVAALRKATPDSAPRLKAAGDILYDAELYAEALPFFQRALELDSTTWVHHTDIAYTLAQLGKPDEALAAMERGVAILPKDTTVRREFAAFLYNVNETGRSIANLDTLAQLAPYSPDPLMYKAEVLLELGEYEMAVEAYEAAITRDPTRGDTHYQLANAHLGADDLESALEEFGTAVRLDSLSSVYHNDLGVTLERMGRLDTALVAYRRAWSLDSTMVTALANVVLTTARIVSPDTAKALLGEWVSRDTLNAYRELFRAQVVVQLEDGPAAVQSAERAIALDSSLVQAYTLLAISNMMQEKAAEADSALARGLAQDSTVVQLWALRGLLHSAQEHHAVAMQYWNRALAIDPTILQDPNLKEAFEASRAATQGATP